MLCIWNCIRGNCNALWQKGRSPMKTRCFEPDLWTKCGSTWYELVPTRSLSSVTEAALRGQVGIPSIIMYWRRIFVFGYCRWNKHSAELEMLERISIVGRAPIWSLVGECVQELLAIVFCQW
jgi:hypothetical protein